MWIASRLTCVSTNNPHCLIGKADRTSRSGRLFHQQRVFMGTERSYSDPCRVLYWLSCTLISLFSQCSLFSPRESFLELWIFEIGQPTQLDDTRLKTHLISYPFVWYCTCEAFVAFSFSQEHLALGNKNKRCGLVVKFGVLTTICSPR